MMLEIAQQNDSRVDKNQEGWWIRFLIKILLWKVFPFNIKDQIKLFPLFY